MANETDRFGLPLLQSAQAQKHVTVNEALMRLDGLVNLTLQSTETQSPPDVVVNGQCWAVPSGATGAWQGEAGQIAIGSNGGWSYVTPQIGMRAFIADRAVQSFFNGTNWMDGALSVGSLGSGLMNGIAEADVTVQPGATFNTRVAIPANVMVIGVTAKVLISLTGTLTSWQLGTEGATNRFGSGLGISKGSYGNGLLGSPMTYYNEANLIMGAQGGSFTGGKVRLGVHWLRLHVPN